MRTVGNKTSAVIRGLDPSSTYYIKLKAYNSAGVGPDSAVVNVTTKRPRKCDMDPDYCVIVYKHHHISGCFHFVIRKEN